MGFEKRLAVGARENPKRYYGYVQSQTKIRTEVTRRLNFEGESLTSDTEIAEGFCCYFASVYRRNTGFVVPLSVPVPHARMSDVQVTVQEVYSKIIRLDPSKAAGCGEGCGRNGCHSFSNHL